MKNITIVLSFLCITLSVNGQNSLVKNILFTNIGPSIMSGRIVDVDVNPNNPNEFYAAYASGGLWYTANNGTSFTPVLDNASTLNVGDIAVDWNSDTIWVGTGESNSSRSSYAGIGVLKSTDKGKTWLNVGLTDSQHIGRIIINKNNPNEVVIGVIGHLYSSNNQRGIFKTTDGGKTWNKTLFIDDKTGIIDISVSPTNSNILFAASWERERKAWNFSGNGENSAIYKSLDAGSTWEKMTTEKSGFPTGNGIGRIGLAAFNDTTIYALLDNQFMRPAKKKKQQEGLSKDDFRNMTKDAFLKLDNEKLNTFLKANRFNKKYSAKSVKTSIKENKIIPSDLVTYLEDANSVLLNSEVIGAEVYKSIDGGKTWHKTHKDYLNGVYSSYGYYFGIIAVNTANENKIYIGGVPLLKSDDSGKSFTSIGKENVHGDHQALWVNSKLDGHIINGNDGGVNITYDDGENWIKNNSPAVGQFYYINVDNQKPYNVFGGLQDNGVWYGSNNYKASKGWESRGNYPYKMIGGGDGMQVQIDSRNNNIVYAGAQFGYYYRVNLKTGERFNIHPKHELGDSPYRYNWQAPILLSPHNQDILYLGANKLLRSMDKGETFKVISEDLTTGGKKGNVPYGTLTTISESPFQFGFIYVGSDDGYVNVTENGGATYNRISNNLPQNLWVSRVIASQHKKDRVYVTLNGYRDDNFKPYVYLSENKGKTWKNIGAKLPNFAVNVIKEDPVDENILYLGTDNELYVTFDKGETWQIFSNGIPNVAIHDLVIQPEAKDLVVGTHGRSIYKTNIAALQEYNTVKNEAVAVFEIPSIKASSRWGNSRNNYTKPYEPSITIPFYVSNNGNYIINVLAADDSKLNSFSVDAVKGFNNIEYDLTVSEKSIKTYFSKQDVDLKKADNDFYYLPKGKYFLKVGDIKKSFEVE